MSGSLCCGGGRGFGLVFQDVIRESLDCQASLNQGLRNSIVKMSRIVHQTE